MKGNLLNKVWLRVMMIVAVMTTTFAGTAQAAVEEYYKLTPVTGNHNSYSGSENITINGITWNVQGNTMQTPWQIGGANVDNQDRSISSTTPIDEIINKVVLSIGSLHGTSLTGSITVNSLKLTVSRDASFSASSKIDEVPATFATNKDDITFVPTGANWPKNSYYRFTFNITVPWSILSPNKYFDFTGATFYAPYVDTPVISGTQVFDPSTQVSISCATSGAAIQYTLDGGVNWHDYSAPFTLTQTTTVIAKATKEGMVDSHEATKTFCKEGDLKEVDWDLSKAPTGSSSQTQVTWTTSTTGAHFANMTLARNGNNNTAANNYLGNGGSRNHTQFYRNQLLTIVPEPGYEIAYVEFLCQTNSTGGLTGTWTNATASVVDGTTVKVTPTDLTAAFSKTFTIAQNQSINVTGVKVHYFPITTPYIAMKDMPINVTSAEADGTLAVSHLAVDMTNAQVQIVDGNNQEVTWLSATLNAEKTQLTYNINANTSTDSEAARVAYITVVSSDGKVSSNTVTVTQNAPVIVSISYVGYGTLYYQHLNLVVPDGIEAYTYTYIPGNNRLTRNTIYRAGDVIPKNSPVALKSETVPARGETIKYAFVESSEAPARDDENLLLGSENGGLTTGDGSYFYALAIKRGSNDPSTIGFYWMEEGGGAFTIGAHKAYLNLHQKFTDMISGTTNVKDFISLNEEEDPTGINEVEFNFNDDDVIYNLAGQRIGKMQKGINIINGKKILK